MTIGIRLKEERKRIGLSQTEFGAAAGVGMKTQLNYEAGERSPDGRYFAAAAEMGVDVRYVITGSHDYEPPPTLTPEEQVLLDHYRAASREVRKAAFGALVGAMPAGASARQVFHGKVGTAVAGDVTNFTQHARPASAKTKP